MNEVSASLAGSVSLGGEVSVNRLGFGAMRLTGEGIWGLPKDRAAAIAVLRLAVKLGVNFIDLSRGCGDRDEGRLEPSGAKPVDSRCDSGASAEGDRGKPEEAATGTY